MNRFYFLLITVYSGISFGQSAMQDSLLNMLATKPESEHAFIYNELAAQKATEDKFYQSNTLAKKALYLSRAHENNEEEYYALTKLAYNFMDLGQIDSSLYFGKEALEIALQTENPGWSARIYNHLGSCYNKISIFDKALSYYLNALKIVEDTLPNTSWELNQSYHSLLLNNIGTVYNSLGQEGKALECFKESLKIRRLQNDLNGIATCLQNIGVLYERNKNYDSTLLLYEEALEIRKKLDQQNFAAELLLNIGITHKILRKYESAEEKLLEAIDILKGSNSQLSLAVSYLQLASLYIKMNKTDESFQYLQQSIKISELHGYKEHERDAYKLLAEYYYLKMDYKRAFESQQKQIALDDSIFNTEIANRIAEMQTRYETEKMENEIDILSRDKKIQSLELKKRLTQVYLLVIFVALIILVLIVTLLLLNRKRLKQRQIKTELEKSKLLESKLKEENVYQSKQLTTHALNMLQKNKLLSELENELKSFASKADDDLKKKLSNIRRQINRNMNSEKDWDLFKLYFEEVNRDFFTSLQEKCKDLTTNDIRLAALIKLNLNIKEAAAVLNISPESMKKARYRLRRKLGLYNREHLADYLNGIE